MRDSVTHSRSINHKRLLVPQESEAVRITNQQQISRNALASGSQTDSLNSYNLKD
jgi:hypothetical protein